ncbi:MAG: pyridoxal phosphate-dependent aminotransferase [Bacteroidetes bacterium]|nr:MAG: pyridoxal phosphate-dependent aminotransferase [Bacteroidota bacterium]
MRNNTPVNAKVIKDEILDSGLEKIGRGSIREIVKLVNRIEARTGTEFIRMEMGVPGLDPAKVGIEAEIEALKRGVASKYPMIEGVKDLKEEISRFIKLFLNIDISPEACIPTVGSMMGAMASFMVANRNDHTKEGTLFIDPGFPVQKQQVRVLGHDYCSFDIYDFRGPKLRSKLLTYFKIGKISSILYSNPNNPSWICFTEEELQIIGELANKYDVIVIEDLAYFGMDFRKDYSQAGKPPYQPTVGKYTDNYILLISSSKAFSYAGQRVGMMAISDKLFARKYPDLLRYYTSDGFGYSMIYGALYALSSGVTHSAQYGLAGILKAVNNGSYNYFEDVKEYGEKAKIMKQMFLNNGFKLVYDKDIDQPIADGFYFTFSYPGFAGVDLLAALLYYGISAISLEITGSSRKEGVRACVSLVPRKKFNLLEERLMRFNADHSP